METFSSGDNVWRGYVVVIVDDDYVVVVVVGSSVVVFAGVFVF